MLLVQSNCRVAANCPWARYSRQTLARYVAPSSLLARNFACGPIRLAETFAIDYHTTGWGEHTCPRPFLASSFPPITRGRGLGLLSTRSGSTWHQNVLLPKCS